MEDVYLKGQKVDWATEEISLKNYFDKFYNAAVDCFDGEFEDNSDDKVEPLGPKDSEMAKINSFLGLPYTREQFDSLKENCSPQQLAMAGENPEVNVDKLYNNPGIYERALVPIDVELETFKRLRNKKKSNDDLMHVAQKYRNQIHLNSEYKTRKIKTNPPDIKAGEQFIVSVRVFFPFHSSTGDEIVYQQASCSQEVNLLGSNTLAELKDVIICMEEYGDAAGDASEHPSAPVTVRLKDVYTSSMFFIGKTFYIDRRHQDNIDYSEIVRSWAKKRNIQLNDDVKLMEATKIDDLNIKFGYPYLYQHLGDCEHLIVFSDARLLLLDDIRDSSEYPKYMGLGRRHTKNCHICKKSTSRWFVIGSERVPRDPCFVCNTCFTLYFYKGEKKIGTFQAFHYADPRAIM